MKELLEDVLEVLNALPNRKLRGKDWTTYELAKRVEQAIVRTDIQKDLLKVTIGLTELLKEETNEQS